MTTPTPSLVTHFEAFLGEIEAGWSKDADGSKAPFQVVRFAGTPVPGYVAFSTLGLSHYEVSGGSHGKLIRQKLMMIVPESPQQELPVPGILQQVGREVLEKHMALLRGDVVGPRGALFPESQLEALYAAVPVYLPDEFGVCHCDGMEVLILWLVPITHDEAHCVLGKGWRAFEEQLIAQQPGLCDINRTSIDC